MADLCLKRNDRRPSFRAQLVAETGKGLALTGASSVHFVMTERLTGREKVDAPVVVEDPAIGVVRYDWADGDTDTRGYFDAHFLVTFPDGSAQTIPACGTLTVDIE